MPVISSVAQVHTGSWGTPDFKITENIQKALGGGVLTNQGGSTLNPFKSTQPDYLINTNGSYQPINNVPSYTTPKFQQILGISTGQQSGGGNGNGGGASGGGNGPMITLNTPNTYSGPSEQDAINQQKAIYDQAANDIQAQNPQLDQSYNLAKGDIQAGIDESTAAANAQKQNLNQDFGSLLKNQLQTYQDLNRQRQGTFSALGTLDSSSFGEQQFRSDQNYADQRGQTQTEQQKSLNQVDTTLKSYVDKANNQLGQLAIQYQSGKNAIASALANNDLQSAAAISQAIDKIKTRAQEVQNSMIDFANQASMLKAQGYDVKTNIGSVSAAPYAQQMANMLSQMTAQGNSTYTIPTSSVQGQGYISSSGKRFNSYADYLKAAAAGQA